MGKGLEENESRERKVELDRTAAMLSRLGKRGYLVQEEPEGSESISMAISMAINHIPNQRMEVTFNGAPHAPR